MLLADTLSVEGAVLTPASAGYDQARQIWNAAVDKRPALIVQCASAAWRSRSAPAVTALPGTR